MLGDDFLEIEEKGERIAEFADADFATGLGANGLDFLIGEVHDAVDTVGGEGEAAGAGVDDEKDVGILFRKLEQGPGVQNREDIATEVEHTAHLFRREGDPGKGRGGDDALDAGQGESKATVIEGEDDVFFGHAAIL